MDVPEHHHVRHPAVPVVIFEGIDGPAQQVEQPATFGIAHTLDRNRELAGVNKQGLYSAGTP